MSLRANYFNLRKRLQMRVSRQMPKLTQHSFLLRHTRTAQ